MPKTLVMGILNVTPNSFADGGKYFAKEDAINQGRRLFAEGADIIDVGGESTKPGVERVSQEEELTRVIPVITELVKDGATISVDTMRAEVARAAIAAGAVYVNDVSGGLADEKMASLIAENPKIQYIVMHWRGHSKDMQSKANYQDVVKEVRKTAGPLKPQWVINTGPCSNILVPNNFTCALATLKPISFVIGCLGKLIVNNDGTGATTSNPRLRNHCHCSSLGKPPVVNSTLSAI